jgi:hypothetical protein
MAAAHSPVPVRGTQSFVYTLSACWGRPSLTALEVLWRWAFGIPALAVATYEALRIWNAAPVDTAALQRMTFFDPMGASVALGNAASVVLAPAERVAVWLLPALAVVWVIVSAIGRGKVLRRIAPGMASRSGTLIVLQSVRLVALSGSFALWFACVHAAAGIAIASPIAAGEDPNLVLYSAIVIVSTLGLFTLWAVVSWALSVAPILAMRRNLGALASLAAALRVGPLKSKLVEINLVMGIVKIALIVLALVLSACPLPFETVATPEFMTWWYAGVTVLYLLASDFFHVVQLVSYVHLWNVYDTAAAPSLT